MLSRKSLSMAVAFVSSALAAGSAMAEQFTVVALPDTQCYAKEIKGGSKEMFAAQTAWIKDNAAAQNIKFVSHLGDVVENQNDLIQWSNAKLAMRDLELSGVPFGTCVGNHDTHYGPAGAKDHAGTNYLANFGPDAPYALGGVIGEQVWYGAASPSGRSNYNVVKAGEYDFLFLSLSIDCPPEELTWAQGVLNANRNKPTVLSTHRYLYDFKLAAGYYGDSLTGRPTEDHSGLANESYYREEDGTVHTTWSEDFARDFVKTNTNIFMVLTGHCHAQYHRTVTNNAGLPVIEALTDYQDGPAGGAGWMRTMKIDTQAGTINFETFSPFLGKTRDLADDFAETLVLVSLYKEALIPQMPGLGNPDPATPEGRALIATVIADMQKNMDGATNPEIAALLQGLDLLDSLPESVRQTQSIFPVWQAWDEVRTYVKTNLSPAAWQANGDWDGLWGAVFAGGERDPQFTATVNFATYVPEPASLSLVAVGALGLLRRRR